MDKTLTSLKKIKDPFFRGQEFRMAETSETNEELDKQKIKLLQEINKLSRIYFSLKGGSEKVKKDIVGFETDRIKTLENLAYEVSLELDDEAEVLKKRSQDLDKDQLFLEELYEYLAEFMSIVDESYLNNEKKSVELEKMTTDTSNKGKKLSKLLSSNKKEAQRLKDLKFGIERNSKTTEELLKSVQEGVEQKNKEWERKDDKLEIERAELRNMKMLYKGKEEKLKVREKVLEDKQRAFERKLRELEMV